MTKFIMTRNVKITIPTRPTKISIEDVPMDISNFDESELRRVGMAWTELLINEAESMRTAYDKKPKTQLD